METQKTSNSQSNLEKKEWNWRNQPAWLQALLQSHSHHFCLTLHEMYLGISNFLDEISSLSTSVVFLYFFALIAEEGFLISSCYSLELCIQMLISFLFSFAFTSLLLTAICKASPDSHFAFLHFFSMGMVLIPVSYTMSRTSFHSSSGTLSIRSRPLNLFLTSTV